MVRLMVFVVFVGASSAINPIRKDVTMLQALAAKVEGRHGGGQCPQGEGKLPLTIPFRVGLR